MWSLSDEDTDSGYDTVSDCDADENIVRIYVVTSESVQVRWNAADGALGYYVNINDTRAQQI